MPRESFESALDRLLADERISRRRFMGRTGSAALAASTMAAFISACGGAGGEGGEEGGGGQEQEVVSHPKTPLTELVISNWPLYIDKAVLKDFRREHKGLELRYREDVNDNTEFFGKVRQPLQQGDSIGRDMVVLTDWMAARWIRLNYVEGIDQRNIPNARKNLQDTLLNPAFDRGRRMTMPWQSGMTAIGYNRKVVGEVKSMKQLFDPKYKGKVTMLADARDSSSMVLLMDGIRPEEATVDQVLQAIEKIDEQNRKGQIRRFTGNDYTGDLTKGNVVMSVAYSGDLIQLKADNPDLDFVIPEEGAVLWSDNMMIPKKAANPYAAEVFMDYVYQPEVAAKIAAYVNYVTPVDGAQEVLEKRDPKLANDPLIFPSRQDRERLSAYPNLTVEEEQQVNEAFAAVEGA
jgi:spermidine/putrescine transport system substrate-binding protein